jgi:hypothetical protein
MGAKLVLNEKHVRMAIVFFRKQEYKVRSEDSTHQVEDFSFCLACCNTYI